MASSLNLDDVTVIVVTYNSAHCIAGLAPILAALPHVTIVDNASNDETVEKAKIEIPNAKVVRNPRNLGFGAANNVALREVTTPYALLLNPDCLATTDFLHRLLEVAQSNPDAAIIAPHLISRNGAVEVNYRWPSTHWQSRGVAADGLCCVGFVCGAVMLMNMQIVQEVGLFDEDFFLYYEDDDLCQRLFAKRKTIMVAPHIHVTHLSRGSVRGNSPLRAEFYRGYHHAQSKLIFSGKHLGARHTARLRWKTLLLAIANLLPRLLVPAPRHMARLIGRICGLCKFRKP